MEILFKISLTMVAIGMPLAMFLVLLDDSQGLNDTGASIGATAVLSALAGFVGLLAYFIGSIWGL